MGDDEAADGGSADGEEEADGDLDGSDEQQVGCMGLSFLCAVSGKKGVGGWEADGGSADGEEEADGDLDGINKQQVGRVYGLSLGVGVKCPAGG